jgi:hypothetical protein
MYRSFPFIVFLVLTFTDGEKINNTVTIKNFVYGQKSSAKHLHLHPVPSTIKQIAD